MPFGGDSEEVRKRITSVLLAGDLVVNIDNVVRPLKSDALAMVLTQRVYADRILGGNQIPRLPTNVLFLATGNNLTFEGDLTTRAIVSRIDPRVEAPEERTFAIIDLRGHIRRERINLVRAGLVILRAYQVAGSPKQDLDSFGRSEQWSDWIRSAIVWLGQADPCKTRDRITLNDPERVATATVLASWHELFADQMVLLRDVVSAVEDTNPNLRHLVDENPEAKATLREAFLNVAASGNSPQRIDVRRLAAWCRDHTDRVAGKYRLTRGEIQKHKTMTRRVVEAVEKGDRAGSTDRIQPYHDAHDAGEELGGDSLQESKSHTGENDPSDPCNPPVNREIEDREDF